MFTNTGMKQNLPELVVKAVIKPAGLCGLDAHRPVNGGKGLVVGALQSSEMMNVRVAHGPEIILRARKVSRIPAHLMTFPPKLIQTDFGSETPSSSLLYTSGST